METDASTGIVKRTEPLSEDFLSPGFPGREKEGKEIAAHLGAVARRRRPQPIWITGPPGAGKTSTVKRALAELEERHVRTAYINCWHAQSFYAILDRILEEVRALVGETRDVAFKYERLARLAGAHPLVVVLDEVDQVFLRERNSSLYNLSNLRRVGIVCLSQTREAYLALDPRVHSRLQPRFLTFDSYSPLQLRRIIRQRAEASLADDSWCEADLHRIAEVAGGDARIAIQTLRTAAYLAEKKRVPQISTADITAGLEKNRALRRQYLLKSLSEHHRLLYDIVNEDGKVTLEELWKRYRKQAPELGLTAMSRRTFNNYRQYLVTQHILAERQGRGRNNTRTLTVAQQEAAHG